MAVKIWHKGHSCKKSADFSWTLAGRAIMLPAGGCDPWTALTWTQVEDRIGAWKPSYSAQSSCRPWYEKAGSLDDPTPKATNSSTPCGQKPSAARWAPRLVSAHCCNKAKKRPASVSMMQRRCSFVFCKHAACLGGPKCRPPKNDGPYYGDPQNGIPILGTTLL